MIEIDSKKSLKNLVIGDIYTSLSVILKEIKR